MSVAVDVSTLDGAIHEYLANFAAQDGIWVTALGLQFELSGGTDTTCRGVRAAIRRLNEAGVPVISSRHGFRLATTRQEIEAYKLRLIQRAKGIMDRVAALETVTA